MTDKGRKLTNRELNKLERELSSEYIAKEKRLQSKIRKTLKLFEALDSKQRQLVQNDKMTKESYDSWRQGQLSHSRWMNSLIDDIANDMLSINKNTAKRINDTNEAVFLKNRNYGIKSIEEATGSKIEHKIYKKATVRNLLKDNPRLMPRAGINESKDLRWNKQKLRSMIMQSISGGEDAKELSERLSRIVTMNRYSAIRSARTITTGMENSALLDSFFEAREAGVPIKKMWVAIHDEKTRVNHRLIDGEVRELEEPFSNGLMYPGDLNGEAREVFNCRCVLKPVIGENAGEGNIWT